MILAAGCKNTPAPEQRLYNKTFDWSITIPRGFDTVSKKQWDKIQKRGIEAIEKTYEEKVENNSKNIFVFKSGSQNYFESSYQPFDTAADGNYAAVCRDVYNIACETLMAQIPGIELDTLTTSEKIDKLDFTKFRMKANYPNGMQMHMIMYSRLFGKNDFSVNMMYFDTTKGALMLESWRNSKFLKKAANNN
jgi:hypothetical protein